MSAPLTADDLAGMREHAERFSSGQAAAPLGALAGYVLALIAEIERRDRAALARWNGDASALGPLFKQKARPE